MIGGGLWRFDIEQLDVATGWEDEFLHTAAPVQGRGGLGEGELGQVNRASDLFTDLVQFLPRDNKP